MKIVPEHILRLMSPEDRKTMGTTGFTKSEAIETSCKRQEKEIHDQFIAWLNLNEIPFIHCRMDKKSTIKAGWPDFTVLFNQKAVCIEFKAASNVLSQDQIDCMQQLRKAKIPVLVFWSFEMAVSFVKEKLLKDK